MAQCNQPNHRPAGSMHEAGLYNERYGIFRLVADGEIASLPRPDGSAVALRCINNGDLSLILDPYPFAESGHTFPIKTRLLPDKPYRNAEEFLAEMAKAELTILECRLIPD